MKIKTIDQWLDSGLPIEEFFQIDDLVDFEIVAHIYNSFPSLICNDRAVQIAQPSVRKNGKPYYPTIEEHGGSWVYAGLKRRIRDGVFITA